MTMKAAAVLAEREAGLVDQPVPRPKENWALVKVHVAPMCTEYKMFQAGRADEYLGHEAVGEIVEIAQPGRVKVGDRVLVLPQTACGRCPHCTAGEYVYCENNTDFEALHGSRVGSATMAQYLLKPDWLLPPIPEDLSYERAGMANCALGPGFGAMKRMGLGRLETVLITGAGPVGLGTVVVARCLGARVIVAESVAHRAALARELGAEEVVDPTDPDAARQIRDLAGGDGVDCACECAGCVPAERLCLDAVRRRGRIAFVGECNDDLPIRVGNDMLRKGLTIHGSWNYNLGDVPAVFRIIQETPGIERLTTHVLPMSRIQEALELCATHETGKVMLHPWE